MEELIKIEINNDLGQRVVSARDLHTTLQSKQEFVNWIKNRIEKYGFIQYQDFVVFDNSVKNPQGGRPTKEYALTIDMAKEVAMIENNENGRKIRQYFISVEKAAKTNNLPQSYSEALYLAYQQQLSIEKKNNEIARLKPKAEFAEKAMECNELTEVSMACKVLDLPYGRNTFFKLLRKSGVFFKNRNEPMQRFVDMGYFKVKQKVIMKISKPDMIVNVPFLTEKGIIRMSSWLKERGFDKKSKVYDYINQKELTNENH